MTRSSSDFEAMIVTGFEAMIATGFEAMIVTGFEVMIVTGFEAMIVTGFEAMIVTGSLSSCLIDQPAFSISRIQSCSSMLLKMLQVLSTIDKPQHYCH
jgi:hypothetical protein